MGRTEIRTAIESSFKVSGARFSAAVPMRHHVESEEFKQLPGSKNCDSTGFENPNCA
jgi:hypothetical protein